MRLGIIGCGGIAYRRVLPAISGREGIQVTAVCDALPEVAKKVAEEYRVPEWYGDSNDLLADGSVDAVYIATPVHLHREQAVTAARAGKHVLIEKPLAGSAADAQAAVDAAEAAGVVLMEAYMMKFHPLHQEAKRLIDSGALGKLIMLRAQLSCWYPPMEGAWRQKQATGAGGALIDMASHLYDLMAWYAGSITEVSAFAGNLVHPYETEDSSLTMLRFGGGAYGIADALWSVPDRSVTNALEIYGEKGSLIASGTLGQGNSGEMYARIEGGDLGYNAAQSRTDSDAVKVEPSGPAANIYLAEVEYFRRCIEEGTCPEINSGQDGVRIMRAIEAAYESARTGRAVKIA